MSAGVLERVTPDVIARPSVRRPLVSWKQLGMAGAALVVGIGAAWFGYQWWTVGRFIESTDDAYVGGDVTVIAPQVAGFIANVAVTDNQAVRAGDLLVKLDDRDYRAALAKAVAAVAGQQATLANLAANRRLQEAVIGEAEAELTATAAEIVRSRSDVDRYRSLAQDHAASVQRWQQADADYQKALAGDARAPCGTDGGAAAAGCDRYAEAAGDGGAGRGLGGSGHGAAQSWLHGVDGRRSMGLSAIAVRGTGLVRVLGRS